MTKPQTISNEDASSRCANMSADERAELAYSALNNPVYVDALAQLEQADMDALLNTNFTDTDLREVYYFRIKVLRDLRTRIYNAMVNLQRPTKGAAQSTAEALRRG